MQLTLLIHSGGEEWDNQEVLAVLLHPSAVSPTLYQAVFAQHMTLHGRGDDFFDPRAWIDWLDELSDPDATLLRADGLAADVVSLARDQRMARLLLRQTFGNVVALAHPDSKAADPTWECVDIRAVADIPQPVSLADVKANPTLAAMALVANSRLSVQPVTEAEWAEVCRMGGWRG